VTITFPGYVTRVGFGLIEVGSTATAWAQPGDSGAICVDADGLGVGYVLAGTRSADLRQDGSLKGAYYLEPLARALDRLMVELVLT
jgi:hypothetical protein